MGRPSRILAALVGTGLLVSTVVGCSKHAASPDAFCRDMKTAPVLATVLAGYTQADTAELTTRLRSARGTYAALAKEAPAKVHTSMEEIVTLVDAVIDAVAAHPTDPAAVSTAIRAQVTDLDGAASASAKVTRYVKATCGFTPDAGVGASLTPGSTTIAGSATTTTAG